MIDVTKACELVTKAMNEPYVSSVIDIGHSFVISTLSKEGLSADVSPNMVNKESGKVAVCFYPDYFEEIMQGEDVAIPDKYKYTE